jgi:hypothetical protein
MMNDDGQLRVLCTVQMCRKLCQQFCRIVRGGGGKVEGGGGVFRAKNQQELAESNTQVSIIMVGLIALPTIRTN